MEVAKDTLDSQEVSCSRIMHEQTDLLNGESNVRSGEGKPRKSANQDAILTGVIHRRAIIGELGTCVHRSQARLAVLHPSTLQDVEDVLTLG